MLDVYQGDRFAEGVLEVCNFATQGGAAIMGGYVRDRILGRAPRDIDVYLTGMPGLSLEEAAQTIRHLIRARTGTQLRPARRLGPEDTHGYAENGVSVYRLENRVGEPLHASRTVELIFMGYSGALPVDHVFRTFDMGICEAAITARGVTTSARFEADAADQAITLRGSVAYGTDGVLQERSQAHVTRVRAKYRGWELREDGTVPEGVGIAAGDPLPF